MAAYAFRRPYCGTELLWYILHDDCHPERAPDVVFASDPAFSPLLAPASPEQETLLHLLDGWGKASSSSSGFDALIGALLALYAQHNKARIQAAVTDERVLFELSMVDALGCTEVLLSGGDGAAGPSQACFTLPVPVDMAPARQLLESIQQQEQPQQQQEQQRQPDQQFTLTVAFPAATAARGSSSSGGGGGQQASGPQLQLHAPAWFSAQLPRLALPGWDAHTSLLEYMPHLGERIERHLADHCGTAVQRYGLVRGLAQLLGPPLETNMDPADTGGSSSSSSSSSSSVSCGRPRSTAGGAAAAASAAAAAVYSVAFEQQPLILLLELPRSYPADPPVLRLQHLRRQGADSCTLLHGLPWSPRWPVDEQVARIFNFLKQQAAAAAAATATAAAAGLQGAGGPAGGSSAGLQPSGAQAAAPSPPPSAGGPAGGSGLVAEHLL